MDISDTRISKCSLSLLDQFCMKPGLFFSRLSTVLIGTTDIQNDSEDQEQNCREILLCMLAFALQILALAESGPAKLGPIRVWPRPSYFNLDLPECSDLLLFVAVCFVFCTVFRSFFPSPAPCSLCFSLGRSSR